MAELQLPKLIARVRFPSSPPRNVVHAGAVGILTYNSTRTIEIDDRSLAHLRNVIYAKLRRRESFAFSWEQSLAHGGGRHSIWLDPDIPLSFEFFERDEIPLDQAWLRELTKSANSPAGLVLVAEPKPGD